MGGGVGDATLSISPFIDWSSGDGEMVERDVDVIIVVACRFAGLLVERETFNKRLLNLVRFMSRAAVAAS